MLLLITRASIRAIAAISAIPMMAQPGRTDRQTVSPAAADRGKRVYVEFCVNCHGSRAQGTAEGPDLIRSPIVLRDRLGSEIGPALKKLASHPTSLTPSQFTDLSHFLKQRVEETVRNRNARQEPNVLTGNADAGKSYFNGEGKCSTCHSSTGDLAGIGRKYNPATLQQRFLFPRSGRGSKPAEVTVTLPSGPPVTGTLDRIDDFNVSLRDAAGEYHAWTRVAELKVEVRDPYAAHSALLDQYTDGDIHNVVTYLETLK